MRTTTVKALAVRDFVIDAATLTMLGLGDRVIDNAKRFGEKHHALSEWQQERLLAQLKNRFPAVAVDGAGGVRYFVSPSDPYIGGDILRRGAFEPEKVNAALALLDRQGVEIRQLLDIGANIGTTTIEILRQRPDLTAVAFEPAPGNFDLLRMNLIANGLDDRVRALRMAVSNTSAPLEFALSDSNPGDHRVRLPASSAAGFGERDRQTIVVEGARLDDIPDLQIDEHTLMFIDTQGHEGHVLAGATAALASKPPIAFELWPYGLDDVGGRGMLMEALRGYSRFFELNGRSAEPVLYSHQSLARWTARDIAAHTDFLALA